MYSILLHDYIVGTVLPVLNMTGGMTKLKYGPLLINIPISNYRQVSNISRTLDGNQIVDHSDVVGASPVGTAPTTSSFLDLTHGFDGLGKGNCKMRRESFKFWDLVRLILEILQYVSFVAAHLFWIPKTDISYYSSTLVPCGRDRHVIRAAIPGSSVVISGFKHKRPKDALVIYDGKPYRATKFEVNRFHNFILTESNTPAKSNEMILYLYAQLNFLPVPINLQ